MKFEILRELPYMENNRIVIYTKDIVRITGKSDRYARAMLKAIRENSGKGKHQFVTLIEFCRYTGIDPKEISGYLR